MSKFVPFKKTLEESIISDAEKNKIEEEVEEFTPEEERGAESEEVWDNIEDEDEYKGDSTQMLIDSMFYLKAMSILYTSTLKRESIKPQQSGLLNLVNKITKKYEQINGKIL